MQTITRTQRVTFIFLTLVLLSLALVQAQTIDIGTTTDYLDNEIVSIVVNCAEPSTLEIIGPDNRQIYFSGGVGTYTRTYNTASNPEDGTYSINVECVSGSTSQLFCLNSPGCTTTTAAPPPTSGGSAPGSSGGSSGGSGGYFCRARWSCGTWSYCNSDLQQVRECVDISPCGKQPRIETQECDVCDESWICSAWSACSNGIQQRTCVDEHACSTLALQPDTQKTCGAGDSGLLPSRVSGDLLPPQIPLSPQQQPTATSFFDRYKTLLYIGAGVILLAAIIGLIALIYYHKKPKMVYDLRELKTWIKKEHVMGTTDEDIRAILMEKTGWKHKEIEEAFKELVTEQKDQTTGMGASSQINSNNSF